MMWFFKSADDKSREKEERQVIETNKHEMARRNVGRRVRFLKDIGRSRGIGVSRGSTARILEYEIKSYYNNAIYKIELDGVPGLFLMASLSFTDDAELISE